MTIPLVDLVAQYHEIKDEMDAALIGVLESGKFILGPNVGELEREIAQFLGVKYAIGVASGTDALTIGLRAAGVAAGDEVIVPAYSFFATAGAVMTIGARPVFVDVDPGTFLMDVGRFEAAISSRTTAVIPVHLYGQPADMDEILAVAKRKNLIVIEDNAQAFGAEYKGRKTGAIGHVGCLSFYPSKNLGGYGDGGMLTTDEVDIAAKARMLRTHGWKKKYYPEMLGYNSRLDELQAAILRVKLKHVEGWNKRRRQIAHAYSQRLGSIGVEIPLEAHDRAHVYFVYVVCLSERDRVQQKLKEAGIASEVYFPQPIHLAEPCRGLGYSQGQFPVSEQASRSLLALPLYPELSSAQIEEVCAAVQRAVQETR